MSKPFFTPEDFEDWNTREISEQISQATNAKLEKALGPVVCYNISETTSPVFEVSKRQDKLHTHKARLFDIQEIVKEPCNHTPYRLAQPKEEWRCGTCGVTLVARWEAE